MAIEICFSLCYNNRALKNAGLVYRYYSSFPSWLGGFDSRTPLHHVGASCISLALTFYAYGKKVRVRSFRCSSLAKQQPHMLGCCLGMRGEFGRHIVRSDVYSFRANVTSHSFCRSSFQGRSPALRGSGLGFLEGVEKRGGLLAPTFKAWAL